MIFDVLLRISFFLVMLKEVVDYIVCFLVFELLFFGEVWLEWLVLVLIGILVVIFGFGCCCFLGEGFGL